MQLLLYNLFDRGKILELNENFINILSIDEDQILKNISDELTIPVRQIRKTVNLLNNKNTIPFIARYRKEVTGSLDENQIRNISSINKSLVNLETRKIEIIKVVFNRGLLTEELYHNFDKCSNLTELESLYAPYKQKKKTRAMIAIEKGLSPLAEKMFTFDEKSLLKEAEKFINNENNVTSIEDAITGAMDIVAEKISQDISNRNHLKVYLRNNAVIKIKGNKDKDSSVYKMYYDYNESLKTIKPHRILAINRGEKEKELKIKIDFNIDETTGLLQSRYKINNKYFAEAIEDGLKRLLIPSLEREIRSDFTDHANKHSINVFAENLKNLLMQPPIIKTRVMGIDPGIRTGSKASILNETGKYIDSFLFYQKKADESKNIITEYVKKYDIKLIAIGDGTGSHEVQEIVSKTIIENKLDIFYTVVSEDGASVYSASDIARKEFPGLDLTVKGAISIGRRIQDPLAELIKIDSKSIGVGLYQHDINQKELSCKLEDITESVVNNVGVNINTASSSLLKYVSGINSTLASKIVKYREMKGRIENRMELQNIEGMGENIFEQAAGFMKIFDGTEKLDSTWVHPENYGIAKEILKINPENLEKDIQKLEDLEKKYSIGKTTIKEIINELKKPALDPRKDYPKPILQKGVMKFDDLQLGMSVKGKVKNVVDFGAFIDIGIKENGLLHISQMSNKFIKSPMNILKAGDIVESKIIDIDYSNKRISLSIIED